MKVQSLAEMARCVRTRRVLQVYVDDETGPAAARRVAEHLRACGRCGLQAATYQAIKTTHARRGGRPDEPALHRLHAFTAAIATVVGGPENPHGGPTP